MFEKHKQEKTAKELAAAQATWELEDNTLKDLLSVIVNGGGPQGGGPSGVPLVLKKDERAVYLFAGSGLFEPRRGPGHYAGASSGFSIPIGSTGVHYRIGQSRGTFVQGEENPTVIDTGTVVITDQRVVFMGAKRTVEWAFQKLVAIQHYQNRPWTAIQVSNRQKVTGVTYDEDHQHNFRLRLEAAVGLFNRTTDELVSQVTEAISAHDAERPHSALTGAIPAGHLKVGGPLAPADEAVNIAPPIISASLPPPAWYPDPQRRHQHRYWDGTRWTDQVADAGLRRVDPL